MLAHKKTGRNTHYLVKVAVLELFGFLSNHLLIAKKKHEKSWQLLPGYV